MSASILDTNSFNAAIAESGGADAHFKLFMSPVIETILMDAGAGVLDPQKRNVIFARLVSLARHAAQETHVLQSMTDVHDWALEAAVAVWQAVFREGMKTNLWRRNARGDAQGFDLSKEELALACQALSQEGVPWMEASILVARSLHLTRDPAFARPASNASRPQPRPAAVGFASQSASGEANGAEFSTVAAPKSVWAVEAFAERLLPLGRQDIPFQDEWINALGVLAELAPGRRSLANPKTQAEARKIPDSDLPHGAAWRKIMARAAFSAQDGDCSPKRQARARDHFALLGPMLVELRSKHASDEQFVAAGAQAALDSALAHRQWLSATGRTATEADGAARSWAGVWPRLASAFLLHSRNLDLNSAEQAGHDRWHKNDLQVFSKMATMALRISETAREDAENLAPMPMILAEALTAESPNHLPAQSGAHFMESFAQEWIRNAGLVHYASPVLAQGGFWSLPLEVAQFVARKEPFLLSVPAAPGFDPQTLQWRLERQIAAGETPIVSFDALRETLALAGLGDRVHAPKHGIFVQWLAEMRIHAPLSNDTERATAAELCDRLPGAMHALVKPWLDQQGVPERLDRSHISQMRAVSAAAARQGATPEAVGFWEQHCQKALAVFDHSELMALLDKSAGETPEPRQPAARQTQRRL